MRARVKFYLKGVGLFAAFFLLSGNSTKENSLRSLPKNVIGTLESGAPAQHTNALDDRAWFKDKSMFDLGTKLQAESNWGNYFITSSGGTTLQFFRAPAPFVLDKRDELVYKENHRNFPIPYPDYYKYPSSHYLSDYRNNKPFSGYLKSQISYYPLQTVFTGYYAKEGLEKPDIMYDQTYSLSKRTYTTTLGMHNLVTEVTNTEMSKLASGTRELNSFLNLLKSRHAQDQLSSMKATKNCTSNDLLEIEWQKDVMVKNTNQTIAGALAKLTRPSVMDYNLNFAQYIKGKVLFVSSQNAKERLSKVLVSHGIAPQIEVVSSTKYSPKVPLDDSYFAVERNADEIESAKKDYWGYDNEHADFYRYRYGYIDDVRFNIDLSQRKPIDGFFQEIARQRGVENCRLAMRG